MAQMSIDGELVKQGQIHSFCLWPFCQSIVPKCSEPQWEWRVQTWEDVCGIWRVKIKLWDDVYNKLPVNIFVLNFFIIFIMRMDRQCYFPFSMSEPSVERVSGLLTSHLDGSHRYMLYWIKDRLNITLKHRKKSHAALQGIKWYVFIYAKEFSRTWYLQSTVIGVWVEDCFIFWHTAQS